MVHLYKGINNTQLGEKEPFKQRNVIIYQVILSENARYKAELTVYKKEKETIHM